MMINFITAEDLSLVKQLSTDSYPSLGLTAAVSEEKRNKLSDLRRRLRGLSDYFKARYDDEYGIFESENSTGNPVGLNGKLKRVWSGVFKGSENKQYAAQISFVINTTDECMDVGFYFGRASALSLSSGERKKLEEELLATGMLLSNEINQDESLRLKYYDLFELGFRAEIKDEVVNPEEWLKNAGQNPSYSSVICRIYPNALGYIDMETIDFYVSMVMPFMAVIPERIDSRQPKKKRILCALTPEQWAKRAERLALIGLDGERFVLKYEKQRLSSVNSGKQEYPLHVALDSPNYGYDILSCDKDDNDIFIEVKTTTLPKNHPRSSVFFLSTPEYEFYKKNKSQYKLYRVWNIYNDPSIEEIDLQKVKIESNGFMVTIDQ